MSNCIFCKIVSGEIPSIKIREDDDFIALLDIFPNTKGQTVVLPKKHYSSNIADIEASIVSELMIATQKVINILRKGLEVERVGIIIEGLQVDHVHARLYPFFGNKGFENGIDAGPQANIQELQTLATKIVQQNK